MGERTHIAVQHITLESFPESHRIPPFIYQISMECGEVIWRETKVPVRIVFVDRITEGFITRYPEVNWNVVVPVIAQDRPRAIALDPSCFNTPEDSENLCLILNSNGRSYIFHELLHFINAYPRGERHPSAPAIDLTHYILNEYEAEYFGVLWGLCYALEKPTIPFGHFMPVRNLPPRIIGERGPYNQMACFLAQYRLATEGSFDEALENLHHDALNTLQVSRYQNDWNLWLGDQERFLPGVREQLLGLESALGTWNFHRIDALPS